MTNQFYSHTLANYTKQHSKLDLPRSNSRSIRYSTISLSSSYRCVFFWKNLVAEKESKRKPDRRGFFTRTQGFHNASQRCVWRKKSKQRLRSNFNFFLPTDFFSIFWPILSHELLNFRGQKWQKLVQEVGTHWGHATVSFWSKQSVISIHLALWLKW